MTRPRFHLAFPVHDLTAARGFYKDLLGAREGRSSDRWVDFDFYEHQLVAHLVDGFEDTEITNPVDGKVVPVRHFGLIITFDEWHALANRLREHDVNFLIEPYIRFNGEPGEQGTFFVKDPSGNALEFKAFRNDAAIFATD